MRKMTIGCAGDARVDYVERSRDGRRSRTLTLVNDQTGLYRWLSDVPAGNRLSGLTIPRYGNCANWQGSAGAPNLDPAAGNGR
jgi:hypothetical protein